MNNKEGGVFTGTIGRVSVSKGHAEFFVHGWTCLRSKNVYEVDR